MGHGERDREWECVCKRDRVGDGRECESVREQGMGEERESRGWERESRRWKRELVWDGGEKERIGDGRDKVEREREYLRERERDSRQSKREWEREREGGWECVKNIESRGWERRERGRMGVCV